MDAQTRKLFDALHRLTVVAWDEMPRTASEEYWEALQHASTTLAEAECWGQNWPTPTGKDG